ncbi:MAG: hypothetical protein KatS3mg072_1712 [Meiothermus sp.]|nr:MAG: hypothetical protein KatS3mg072_1712 [Meiothermus sp.]
MGQGRKENFDFNPNIKTRSPIQGNPQPEKAKSSLKWVVIQKLCFVEANTLR